MTADNRALIAEARSEILRRLSNSASVSGLVAKPTNLESLVLRLADALEAALTELAGAVEDRELLSFALLKLGPDEHRISAQNVDGEWVWMMFDEEDNMLATADTGRACLRAARGARDGRI